MKTAAAIAYSYLRFSSPAQSEGDSVRRQTALRDAWLKRHPAVRLDTSLTLVDAGVSGYSGAHRKNKKHALAAFLDLVDRGRVPVGSFLIVENLDRLTRENPVDAIPAVLALIKAGVRVVGLTPAELVYDAEMDQSKLMFMLMELGRGHAESKRKSGLCGEAWRTKKEQARKDKTPHGAACPAWLELADGKYRLKADAAKTVRKIFRWCADGLGSFGILQRLHDEGIPAFGRTGRWERSYVRKILNSVAVIGTYQPHNGSRGPTRKPSGDPIPGYYPAVIDEQLWYAAQAAIKARERKSGRPASVAFNPFSGLLYSALDGSKLHVTGTNGTYRCLVSSAAIQKQPGAKWESFPLDPFVSGILSELRELSASELFSDPSAAVVATLNGRLAEVETRLAKARERFDADPDSPTWADMVSKYDREKQSLVRELAEARAAAANPLSSVWSDAVEQMSKEEPQRLRAALLETVEAVYVVFASRGTLRLAAAQVFFKGGATRDYVVAHRNRHANGTAKREPNTQVVSVAAIGVGPVDFRKAGDLRKVLRALEQIADELTTGRLTKAHSRE